MKVLVKHGEAVEIIAHLCGGHGRVAGADLQNHAVGGAARAIDEGLDLLLLEQIDQLGIALNLIRLRVAGHGENHSHHDDQDQDVRPIAAVNTVSACLAQGIDISVDSSP